MDLTIVRVDEKLFCGSNYSLALQDNDTKVRDGVTIYLNNKALYTNMTGYGNRNISARPSLYRSS